MLYVVLPEPASLSLKCVVIVYTWQEKVYLAGKGCTYDIAAKKRGRSDITSVSSGDAEVLREGREVRGGLEEEVVMTSRNGLGRQLAVMPVPTEPQHESRKSVRDRTEPQGGGHRTACQRPGGPPQATLAALRDEIHLFKTAQDGLS